MIEFSLAITAVAEALSVAVNIQHHSYNHTFEATHHGGK